MMNNYFNIIPTILIFIFIILLLKGLGFFIYLIVLVEKLITTQLNNVVLKFKYELEQFKLRNSSYTTIIELLLDNQLFSEYITSSQQDLNTFLQNSMDNEKQHLNESENIGLIIFVSTLLGIIVFFIAYVYIVRFKLSKTIDWFNIIITVVVTFILIIIMGFLYIKYVLFNKIFNYSQFKIDFINAIMQ